MIAALLRRSALLIAAPLVREVAYAHADAVGYQSWLELPRIGVLAFRTLDGNLITRW